MKKIAILFFLYCVSQQVMAQHFLEKDLDVHTKHIEIICSKIDELTLLNSSNNKVQVKLVDAQGSFTGVGLYTEKDRLIIKQKEALPPQEMLDKFCVEQPNFASYVISVPINSSVIITIQSGNLNISNFKGSVRAQVETGMVILHNNAGQVNLKIVDGAVKTTVKNAKLNLNTNLGTIESNLPLLKATNHHKTLVGNYKNNHNSLTVSAIKANIYVDAVKN